MQDLGHQPPGVSENPHITFDSPLYHRWVPGPPMNAKIHRCSIGVEQCIQLALRIWGFPTAMDNTGFDPQLVEYEDAKPRDRGHGLYILGGRGGSMLFKGQL